MYSQKSIILICLTSVLLSCTPQNVVIENTPTQPEPASTVVTLPTLSTAPTLLPSETPFPTDIPSITPASCVVALNPVENASVPAKGPFDFTWTPFTGAASYVVSIGPSDWYPTNFTVTGTSLTRYMEIFQDSPSYEWSIAALDSSGQEICKTGPYTFKTSPDQYATPSFAGNVSSSEENNGDTSSNSSSGSNNGSGNKEYSEFLVNIQLDSDSECRLSVSYRIKTNQPIQFARLYYSYDGGATVEFVDLVAYSSDPYPAYNHYSATTPPLPVTNGTIVQFGAGFTGATTGGLTLYHTMTSCN